MADEEFQVGFITYYILIQIVFNFNCWKRSFTQPYVDWFQSIDPIVAKIIGQLKEEIEELKGCNEELKEGLEKEIQRNKEKEVVKIHGKLY